MVNEGGRAKVSDTCLSGSPGSSAALKQTDNKREHRQTLTDAHGDFFCMTGGTYLELLRGQRADGASELGGSNVQM